MRLCNLSSLCLLAAAHALHEPGSKLPPATRSRNAALVSPAAGSGALALRPSPAALSLAGGGDSSARGLLSLAGGCLVHLVLGTLYCWGNFVSYVPEELQTWRGGPGNETRAKVNR